MIRPTLSKLALSSALAASMVVVSAGCKSTTAAEPEAEQVPVQADDSRPAVVFEAVPAKTTEDDDAVDSNGQGEVTTPPSGELDDYYRDDSRGNIQKMEGQLKPLGVVKPDKPPVG
jgi:hypothetical protein